MYHLYLYLAVFAYFIVGTLVALAARKGMRKEPVDFFLANRAVGGIVAALTYSATTYSAFMMVGLAGFTYVGGVGAWGFELIYLSGLVLVAFFGPRFWLAGKHYNYLTPAELLGDRYCSRALQVITAIGSIVFLIPYSAVQLIGIGTLMEGMSGGNISFTTGLVMATVIAVTWAYIGGMRAVAWTDSLQSLLMVTVSTVALLLVVNRGFGGFGGLFSAIETSYPQWLAVPGPGFFSFSAFVGLSLPWFFFSLSNPQVSQRLFIPRSMTHLRTMITGFMVFGLIYTFTSVMWGFSALVLVPDLPNADLATPALLALDIVPAGIALLVMLGITAAAISTINSIILTLSSMVAGDVIKNIYPNLDENRSVAVGRFFVLVFAAAVFIFASARLGMIAVLSVASSAGLLVTIPAIVGAFFWKRGTAPAAITSIIAGGVVAFWFQFADIKPLGWWPGIWSGIVSTVLFITISLITTPPEKKASEFIEYVNGALKEKNAI